MLRRLDLDIPRPGLHEITDQVQEAITELLNDSRASADRVSSSTPAPDALATVFIQHTSASLTIQENADPSARRDLEAWLARLVPEDDPLYTHRSEGPDDMPSHIRAALTATSLSIPVIDGRLGLGTWQGIYLWEHRRGKRTRRVLVHVAA